MHVAGPQRHRYEMAYDLAQSVSPLNKAHVSTADGGKSRRENHILARAFSNREEEVKTLFKFNEYRAL